MGKDKEKRRFGARPKPDVAHEAPQSGEPSFVCRGPCGLTWPARLRAGGENRCANCRRRARRALLTPERNRDAHLRRRYGLTLVHLEWYFDFVGRACELCHKPLVLWAPDGKRANQAVVDHKSGTRRVRGLLCTPCNTGIGLLREDPALLRAAIDYLGRIPPVTTPAQGVLVALEGGPAPVMPPPTPAPGWVLEREESGALRKRRESKPPKPSKPPRPPKPPPPPKSRKRPTWYGAKDWGPYAPPEPPPWPTTRKRKKHVPPRAPSTGTSTWLDLPIGKKKEDT